jgi:NAD(P)-dependent dehydrogenase (short-subunit alcohol dehydrogenase family)
MKNGIALVTGASSGIGEATANRLAKAGYKVYGTSRRGAQAGQRTFEMLPLDVTSEESVEAAVKEVLRLDGRIDLLVNNAGFGVAPAAAEESSLDQGPCDLRYELLRDYPYDACRVAPYAATR